MEKINGNFFKSYILDTWGYGGAPVDLSENLLSEQSIALEVPNTLLNNVAFQSRILLNADVDMTDILHAITLKAFVGCQVRKSVWVRFNLVEDSLDVAESFGQSKVLVLASNEIENRSIPELVSLLKEISTEGRGANTAHGSTDLIIVDQRASFAAHLLRHQQPQEVPMIDGASTVIYRQDNHWSETFIYRGFGNAPCAFRSALETLIFDSDDWSPIGQDDFGDVKSNYF